jgi:broad specificity phosphatase PhoE
VSGGHELVVVRHGPTTWSASGQHTGRTDLSLTADGEREAAALAPRLARRTFALVLTSPLRRARHTAALAGFGDAIVDDDLAEWDYGDDEGRTSAEIRAERPGWNIWYDGPKNGETLDHLAARADRVIARVRTAGGAGLAFAHGHLLDVLAARWVALPPEDGRIFYLDPASVSVLGWHGAQPVVRTWNSDGR